MEIKLAKSAGFCFGVKKAVDKAMSLDCNGKIFCYGELIHNHIVNDKLLNKGIIIAHSIEDIEDNATVIIRSHGVSIEDINKLESKCCDIIDCTCDFVSKIHNIVNKHYKNGDMIIIIGHNNHPEVIGINGWANNSALIINDCEEFNIVEGRKYIVVVQTTFNTEKYQQIKEFLKNKLKTVEFYDTICYTTRVRQKEALKLATMCDTVLVLGDIKSSNSYKLYDLCRNICDNTFYISDLHELNTIDKKNINILGITAGASTPQELIEEVINYMSDTQDKTMNANVENVNEVVESSISENANTEQLNNASVENTDSVAAPVAEEKAEQNASIEEKKVESKPVADKKVEKVKANTFEDMLNEQDSISTRIGDLLTVEVIAAKEEGIFVKLFGKKDGYIDSEDASIDEYNPDDFKIGDKLDVIVIDKKNQHECISLSKKAIDKKKIEDDKVKAIIDSPEFTFTFTKAVNKGLLGELGSYRIFLPASHIKLGFVSNDDLPKYLNKPLRLRTIEIKENNKEDNRGRKRNETTIYVSSRVILAEEREARDAQYWAIMEPNAIVRAKVKRIRPFGAFVAVEGFEAFDSYDCLVRISDISWLRINDPSDILEINEYYDFVCLAIDKEKNRVSLGYKQLQKTPYELAYDRYPEGIIVDGVVKKVLQFGAVITLEPGVDGWVNIAQIAHEHIATAADKLNVGDNVKVKVLAREGSKYTLSIKEALEKKEYEKVELEEEITTSEKKTKKTTATSDKRRKKQDDKPHSDVDEWNTGSSTTSLSDLFKDVKFDEENE